MRVGPGILGEWEGGALRIVPGRGEGEHHGCVRERQPDAVISLAGPNRVGVSSPSKSPVDLVTHEGPARMKSTREVTHGRMITSVI